MSFQLTGGTETINGTGDDPRIAAGAIQTATLPIRPAPDKARRSPSRSPSNRCPGEQITTNNRFTYPLTFDASRPRPARRRATRIISARGNASRVPRTGGHLLGGRPAGRCRRRGDRPRPRPSVYAAIRAVAEGEADRALVPFENSIEGAVRSTLDTLAFEGFPVTIAGEHDHPIRNSLIARTEVPLERIEVVLSHPQASAQCARFIREQLPEAQVRAAASTAEAVREVAAAPSPWARAGRGIGGRDLRVRGAARGRRGQPRQRDPVRVDRSRRHQAQRRGPVAHHARLLRAGRRPSRRAGGGADRVLGPRRQPDPNRVEAAARGLGRYMFFCDLEGSEDDPAVAEAIDALREKAESVRILGSYPIAAQRHPRERKARQR